MTITVHAGHNSIVPGASGYLDEVRCDREITASLWQWLNAAGNTVFDVTDDAGRTQTQNLNNIVNGMNKVVCDLNVSIHLNAGGGQGVECWVYSSKSKAQPYAQRICTQLSKLGYKNRGVKYSTGLAVLKRSKAPTVLVECGFVDAQTDANLYDADAIARAIAIGIVGDGYIPADAAHMPYYVKVTAQVLNIRADHSASSAKRGIVEYGDVYTIVDTYVNGGTPWGKLKSGAGWICLNYTTKI